MEVFLAYSDEAEGALLLDTANAWNECPDAEVRIIECVGGKFEMKRRIAAENLAEGKYYILCDLGCTPESPSVITDIKAKLSDDVGMMGLNGNNGLLDLPRGVRVCQKGAVVKWLPSKTSSYDKEHADSVELAGKIVTVCPDIFYKPLLAS